MQMLNFNSCHEACYLEVARLVTGVEVKHLHAFVSVMRPKLEHVSLEQFEAFVSDCSNQADTKEALLDLIRQESPTPPAISHPFISFADFKVFFKRNRGALARETLRIADNTDRNNNTGKVKQALFGVQRFLQEYPHYRQMVESLPLKWFDIETMPLMLADWKRFLSDFAEETNDDYAYSIRTLRGYIPISAGGTLQGAGGGNNELKRVWPLVGRALRGR